jgi:hypothetical protein
MPYVGKKKLEEYVSMLNEVKDTATMKHADFSNNVYFGREIPDYFIKEATELWRDTWLVSPIDRIITEFEELLK